MKLKKEKINKRNCNSWVTPPIGRERAIEKKLLEVQFR